MLIISEISNVLAFEDESNIDVKYNSNVVLLQ